MISSVPSLKKMFALSVEGCVTYYTSTMGRLPIVFMPPWPLPAGGIEGSGCPNVRTYVRRPG